MARFIRRFISFILNSPVDFYFPYVQIEGIAPGVLTMDCQQEFFNHSDCGFFHSDWSNLVLLRMFLCPHWRIEIAVIASIHRLPKCLDHSHAGGPR